MATSIDAPKLLALVVLVLVHLAYVAFVFVGPVLCWVGIALRNRRLAPAWLTWSHLLCLIYIGLQLGLGWPCPLTEVENHLAGLPKQITRMPHGWSTPSTVPAWLWALLAAALAADAAALRTMRRLD